MYEYLLQHCRMHKGLRNLFEDIDDVLYALRIDARCLSGKTGFAEAYGFTGPPSPGKSWVVMRLLRFLGEGPRHLTAVAPSG